MTTPNESADYLFGKVRALGLINAMLLECLTSHSMALPELLVELRAGMHTLVESSNLLAELRLASGTAGETETDKGFHDAIDEFWRNLGED